MYRTISVIIKMLKGGLLAQPAQVDWSVLHDSFVYEYEENSPCSHESSNPGQQTLEGCPTEGLVHLVVGVDLVVNSQIVEEDPDGEDDNPPQEDGELRAVFASQRIAEFPHDSPPSIECGDASEQEGHPTGNHDPQRVIENAGQKHEDRESDPCPLPVDEEEHADTFHDIHHDCFLSLKKSLDSGLGQRTTHLYII